MKKILQRVYDYFQYSFVKHRNIYWENLTHFNTLLIIINLSLFFVTRLVVDQGYFYTYYSLLALGVVQCCLLLPLGLLDRAWYYIMCLVCEFIAVYFIIVSVWYWVTTSNS
jgi:hypothetical protein